jgi:hypothetical protein
MLLGIQPASLPFSHLISSSSRDADADADADEGERRVWACRRRHSERCHVQCGLQVDLDLDLNVNLNLNLTCFDLAPWLCFDVRCFPSLLAAADAASTLTITTIVIFCKRSELRCFCAAVLLPGRKRSPWKRGEAGRIGNTAVLCVSGLRQVWLESAEAMLTVQTQVRGCRR